MKTIVITGSSDDLIEIEGDEREEFGGPGFVVLDSADGYKDVFRVSMNEHGCWNITHVEASGDLTVKIERKVQEDSDGYTGKATVTGNWTSMDGWHSWPPDHEEVFDRISNYALDRLSSPQLLRIYEQIRDAVRDRS